MLYEYVRVCVVLENENSCGENRHILNNCYADLNPNSKFAESRGTVFIFRVKDDFVNHFNVSVRATYAIAIICKQIRFLVYSFITVYP